MSINQIKDELKKFQDILEDAVDSKGEGDKIDTVELDVPLLIRIMELSREELKTDADLHIIADKMIELSKDGTLTMDHYGQIVESLPMEDYGEEESPMDHE